STLLRESLAQFPGVQLVPFGWVAFFIFLYILLIGPGDYFFLKKVLKRMELTWITFPLIVITVSLVAYFAAYAVKGTDLRINKVDAVALDQQPGQLRGSTYLTLFSPQNRDYDVALGPLALVGDPKAARPLPDAETMVSFFGIPESGYGGMNNQGHFSLSSSGYMYEPAERIEALKGVRVPIWSTKSFAGRWFGPGFQAVEADLE